MVRTRHVFWKENQSPLEKYFFFCNRNQPEFYLGQRVLLRFKRRTLIPSKHEELVTLTLSAFVASVTSIIRVISWVKEDRREMKQHLRWRCKNSSCWTAWNPKMKATLPPAPNDFKAFYTPHWSHLLSCPKTGNHWPVLEFFEVIWSQGVKWSGCTVSRQRLRNMSKSRCPSHQSKEKYRSGEGCKRNNLGKLTVHLL